MSAFNHRGVVYFATCDRYVKIGYSSAARLETRFKSMFSGRLIVPADIDKSQPLRVIATIEDCISRDEKRIHGLFAQHHAVSEWFHLTPGFIRQLGALQYVTDAEIKRRFRAARADLKRRPSLLDQSAA